MKTLKLLPVLLCFFLSTQLFAQGDVALSKTGTITQTNNGVVSTTALPSTLFTQYNTVAFRFKAYVNNPFLIVNLGAKYDLKYIVFIWGETLYAKNYTIATSPDNITWTNNIVVTNQNEPNYDYHPFNPLPYFVQYVKISNITSSSTSNDIDIKAINIFGYTTSCTLDGAFKKLTVCESAIFNLSVSAGGFNTTGAINAGTITNTGKITTGSLNSIGALTSATLNTTGSVGIGIATTPLAKLHVAGSTYLPIGESYWIGATTDAGNRLRLYHNGTSAYIDFAPTLTFRAGVTPSLTILSNGNVGMGTTNPGFKLDVIGTIRAREIKVNLQGADFVFEKNYKLLELAEVEKFISKNKHLPNIPSAAEMQENGSNLGELNVLLLQKIEELTLYVIELEKRVNDLSVEVTK